MNQKFPQYFWGFTLLAAAFVIASVVVSNTILKVKSVGNTLTVTGSAKKPIISDYIKWEGSVSRKSSDLTAAYEAVMEDIAKVREFFDEKNIPEENIEFQPVESSHLSQREKRPDGSETTTYYWRVTQYFEVHSEDVEGVTKLSAEVTDLIRKGVPVQSYSPNYYYTKIADLRVEMLGEATKDARLRAETIVENGGGTLGPLVSARMGVFQITSRHSTEVSDYGIYDTSSLEKDITAVVKLTFAVE